MRVLALSSWWPEPADNGARMRIASLVRFLAHTHEVHLVALAQEPVTVEQCRRMEQVCASVQAVPQSSTVPRRMDILASLWQHTPASVRVTWNPAFAALVQQRAAAVKPDIVVVFQLGAAPYARLIAGVPRILEEVELTRFLDIYRHERHPRRRLRAWLTWYKHRSYVAHLLRDFAACTVVSEREQRYVAAGMPQGFPVAPIPNGADVQGCAGDWGVPEPDTLIYPGALSFDANFDAMTYFLDAIFPAIKAARPHVHVQITGKTDPARQAALPAHAGVTFTGYVPDVRPVVARSWGEVVPLRMGGGTRLKVLEALALRTPVVSTSKGIEGLDLVHDRHVLVADTAATFAAATSALLSQPDLRARLADAGFQRVRERYDWAVIGRQLQDLLEEIVRRKEKQGYAYRVA